MSAGALAFAILVAAPSTAFGVFGHSQAADPLSRLEDRLRSIYVTLPQNGEGLPDSSGVRYLARRYLEAEHGWFVKGLDMEPWLRDGRNASLAAALRASELLTGSAELATSGPLLAALSPERGRGFTLRETAEAVHALEALVASHDAALMRRARELSKVTLEAKDTKDTTPMEKALLLYTVLLHSRDAELFSNGPERFLHVKVAARRAWADLANQVREDFSADLSEVPLSRVVAKATQDATVGSPQSGARIYSGMRHLRQRLHERYTRGCRRLRGVLSSMDHEASGQVEFRQVYATKLRSWQFLETPEYLRAVGAFTEQGAKGVGPGVLIPNYVSGVNSCDDRGVHPTMFCCPDDCEAEILPHLEAVAAGPRVAPKQVWAALSRLIKGDKMVSADKRKELHSQLRALGRRSMDGLVDVHGRRLGRWLHRAFPHKCRGYATHGSPAVVDPALSPLAWSQSGKYLPVEDALEVEEIRAHLQARWGPDGTGTDPRSFAARSAMSLDQELQLIRKFHEQHKSSGPPVQQALEEALNVRVLDRSASAENLLATILAAAMLGLLVAAIASIRWYAAEVCVSLAAATTRRLRPVWPAAPHDQEGSGHGVGVALSREGPRSACEAGPAGSGNDESTDAGDTDSEVAVVELSAEESDSERETASVSAGAACGCADADDEHPSHMEAALDAATNVEEEEEEEEMESDAQEAPSAAQMLPLAEAAGARWLPSPAALPRGFRPPPGLGPPPGLQLKLEALGLEPDWHHLGEDQNHPTLESTVL